MPKSLRVPDHLPGPAHAQDYTFRKMRAKNLQSDGQLAAFPFHRATRNAEPADPGQVCTDGVDIGKVVLEGSIGELTDPAGRGRAYRANQGVHPLESLLLFLLNEGAGLLGPEVVFPTVAGAENIGA